MNAAVRVIRAPPPPTLKRRFRSDLRLIALALIILGVLVALLLADGAWAQDNKAHISLASTHATTDSNGVVNGFAVREGERLVINFSIKEPRRAASGSFKYALIERPGNLTNKATPNADFPVLSGTITLQGDSTQDAQPPLAAMRAGPNKVPR